MIAALATFAVRRKWLVLASALGFVTTAVALGSGVVNRLSGSTLNDPRSASTHAAQALTRDFHAGVPNLVLLVKSPAGVDSDASTASGIALTRRLAKQREVTGIVSYWTSGKPSELRSKDGSEAMILARITGSEDHATARGEDIFRTFTGRTGELNVRVGGSSVVHAAIRGRIQTDLSRAELIVFPVTFVLLVLVFGGVVAALLPLAIGGIAIVGTLLVLRVLTLFTDVSVYSLNVTTGLGLGLAIDYALFVVTRYREELARGMSFEAAIVSSSRTAGRTVAFSAMTVASSLTALLIFPTFFLRSFGYAGIAVILIAGFGALLVLPALLAALGPRINAWQLFQRRPVDATHGAWRTTALAVMRRPIVLGASVIAVLVVVGLPFLNARFSLPDDRVLPRNAETQQTQQMLRTDFASRSSEPILIVAPRGSTSRAELAAYVRNLSSLRGVADVQLNVPPHGDGFWVTVTPSVDAMSVAAKSLVHEVRAAASPTPVLVGGRTADLVDTQHALRDRLPLAGLLVVAAMTLLLFLFTGSVVVPVKALLLNLLSLSASFGAMVWIFQEGHLGWLVGHPIVTGTLDTSMPILMFCVAFGLSMDYELFLLSRIKESYDATRDNTLAIAVGLERTGRLVTAAAALIAVVWIAFLSSGVTFIKMLGLGMALAVIVDATLVRGVLVPAFMRLAGDWNWWAPKPLRRLQARVNPDAPQRDRLAGAAVESAKAY